MFSINRCKVERGPKGSDLGRAVHRGDAGPDQERERDGADASRRIESVAVRRVAIRRLGHRVHGRRAGS